MAPFAGVVRRRQVEYPARCIWEHICHRIWHPRRRNRGWRGIEAIQGFLFILPWAIGYLLFRLGPLLYSFYLSLTDYRGSGAPLLIGFDNYVYMLTQDPGFIDSVRSTFLFVVCYLPLNLIIGLGIALLMNQKVRGITLSVPCTICRR